jgi:uncharacterized membrane protein YbhN (UPF0104 family)
MTDARRRAYAWVCAIPPRVLLAGKLTFALIAIAVVAKMVDWPSTLARLDGLFLPILAGIALAVPVVMVMALRWKLIMGTETPQRFSFGTAFRGWCLGAFCNLVLPGIVASDAARAHYASVRAHIKYPRSFLVVMTERLFGLLSILLLAGIGVALNDHLDRFTSIPAAQLALGLVVAGAVTVAGVALTRRYTHVPLILFPVLLLLSIAGQSSDYLLVHFYGQAVSVDVPLDTLLLVIPLVFLASFIPLVPGGYGVREATLTGLLTVAGIPVSEAALIALMLFVTKIGSSLLSGLILISSGYELRNVRRAAAQPARRGR